MNHRFSKINLFAGTVFLLMFAAALFYFAIGKNNIETGRMLANFATVGLWACLITEGVRWIRFRMTPRRAPTSAR